MISFALRCAPHRHGFDGWFRSGDDFERQAAKGLVQCPVCGSSDVAKALMKPALATSRRAAPAAQSAGEPASAVAPGAEAPVPATGADLSTGAGFANAPAAEKVLAKLQAMTRELRAKADYVGPRFAAEARRIHYGEGENRRIYGEATKKEVESLGEEGIAAFALPSLPEDHN